MSVNMVPVASSNVAAAGYDDESQELVVEFTSGSIYRYSGAPRSALDAMLNSPSPGSYFARHIRNAYPYVKEA